MKKLLFLLVFFLSACSKVPAGYQGIIVNLYGSEKGVQTESVGTGRYWLTFNQELYLFPVFLQNYTWTKDKEHVDKDESITMQTSEGLTISTAVGITYQISPDNVSRVFQKYRKGIDEITDIFLRNMVRDAMNSVSSTMTVEEIYGAKKDIFIAKVNDLVKSQCKEDGITIDKVYLIGSFQLPENVVNSINAKIQATQNAMKVENEVATTKAEAQKTIIEAQAAAQQITIKAKAQAEANSMIAKSVTSELIQFQAMQKWDGQLPKVSGQNTPFINIGEAK